ncbi:MAG: hypothetical protein ACRD7E_32265, partial [Bryobacteraceae bacterium]
MTHSIRRSSKFIPPLVLAAITAFALQVTVKAQTRWTISPWWHNGAEIGRNVPPVIAGRSPIRYPQIWEREREILRYNPRFLANTVSFDRRNRPVIRVGVHCADGVNCVACEHATLYGGRPSYVEKVYVQMLDVTGQWIALSLDDVMRDNIPDWNNDRIRSGTFQSEERVAFDASGDAYT